MNDQKIIELIRTGKSDGALSALYKNFPMMRKMIRSKGGSPDDAEDIFQEALIILVRKVRQDDLVLTAQLSTYLYSVCRFLWKEELKKRKISIPYDFESGLTESGEQLLSVALEEEARAKMAEKVIEELKERCRELLLLFYEGRFRLKDIATKMGYSSENTAKNQKYKCLEAAKNRLKELKLSTQTL
jgi:RNA polymerase sigma factor (sigma-70 family)